MDDWNFKGLLIVLLVFFFKSGVFVCEYVHTRGKGG